MRATASLPTSLALLAALATFFPGHATVFDVTVYEKRQSSGNRLVQEESAARTDLFCVLANFGHDPEISRKILLFFVSKVEQTFSPIS